MFWKLRKCRLGAPITDTYKSKNVILNWPFKALKLHLTVKFIDVLVSKHDIVCYYHFIVIIYKWFLSAYIHGTCFGGSKWINHTSNIINCIPLTGNYKRIWTSLMLRRFQYAQFYMRIVLNLKFMELFLLL